MFDKILNVITGFTYKPIKALVDGIFEKKQQGQNDSESKYSTLIWAIVTTTIITVIYLVTKAKR